MVQVKRLSIIVPTPDGGRLDRLADSLKNQLRDGDEVLVIGDTHGNDLRQVQAWVERQPHWRWDEFDAGRNAWGHPQINYGITQAKGDYLLFQDDDDVYAQDALVNVRRAVRHLDPPRPVIFKFRVARAGGITLPRRNGDLFMGGIGGHCLVVPNDPDRTGVWTDKYEGDWDFIEETLQKWSPVEPVWRPEVIVHAR